MFSEGDLEWENGKVCVNPQPQQSFALGWPSPEEVVVLRVEVLSTAPPYLQGEEVELLSQGWSAEWAACWLLDRWRVSTKPVHDVQFQPGSSMQRHACTLGLGVGSSLTKWGGLASPLATSSSILVPLKVLRLPDPTLLR